MVDLFRWRADPHNAERLYAYCTMLRLLYARDEQLWQYFEQGVGDVTATGRFNADGVYPVSWVIITGSTGTLVLIEGTTNWQQRITQAVLLAQEPHVDFPGQVNEFDLDRYLELRPLMDQVFAFDLPPRITLIGHSLGGSLAQLLAHRLRRTHPEKLEGCITFGSKKVGDWDYVAGTRFNLFHVFNEGDPVPVVTPPNVAVFPAPFTLDDGVRRFRPVDMRVYRHAGFWGWLAENGDMTIMRDWEVLGFGTPLEESIRMPISRDPGFAHNMTEYARRLRTRLERLHPTAQLQLLRHRFTLDTINLQLNQREGYDWRWDARTGLPAASIIRPNTPPADCGCRQRGAG